MTRAWSETVLLLWVWSKNFPWRTLFLKILRRLHCLYPISSPLLHHFPSFLPSFFLPSFLPSLLPSFLPFLLLQSISPHFFFPSISIFPSFCPLLYALPSFFPSFFPYFLPSFLPYFLPFFSVTTIYLSSFLLAFYFNLPLFLSFSLCSPFLLYFLLLNLISRLLLLTPLSLIARLLSF